MKKQPDIGTKGTYCRKYLKSINRETYTRVSLPVDRKFALMLFAIVGLFLLCQSCKITVNVHNWIILDELSACRNVAHYLGAPLWDEIMHIVARLLLLVNR